MISVLIFVSLAILGLLLIDNFSTSLALLACTLVAYHYVEFFPFVFNKLVFVSIVTKIWLTVVCCFRVIKQIFCLFRKIFSSRKITVPQPSYTGNNFCGNAASVENEINILVAKISGYYIHSWYDKISSNEEFLFYLNSTINDSLISLCTNISKIDKKKFTYVMLQTYLNFFSHFVEAKKKSDVFKKENFKMKHWAMKDRITEWCYLQSLVSALLDSFCPPECERSLHSKYSPLLHSVVVEILTGNLIYPLVNVLCDPSRLNLMLLKLLIHISTVEDKNLSLLPKFQQKDVTSFPDNSSMNKPTILLPNEDLLDNCGEVSSTEIKSENMLSVPDDVFQVQKTTPESAVRKFNNKKVLENTSCFVSSGIKSSSNINISEHSDSRTLDCDNSTFTCDTTIKRSRSADYIRQMPQLKAFNEKDYNIMQSQNNKMLVALKSDVNPNNSIEQAEEAVEFEVPTLFSDIKITDTLQQNEASLLPYTLYCIQYTGVFHDMENSSDSPHLVHQVINIKRRFREFVALQTKLEDNPSLKNVLIGIKGPSKGVALPFSNLDKKNIAERRSFLENYLKELCSLAPIAQSQELQEFLGYGVDEQVSFSRKSADANVPRIDKMLVRGVKSAFDIFKTALPNVPVDEENNIYPSEAACEEANPELAFQEHLLDYSSREPEIYEHAKNFIENSSFEFLPEEYRSSESDPKKPLLSRNILKSAGSCRCPILSENSFHEEKCPLGNSIFELIAISFRLNECSVEDMPSAVKLSMFSFMKLLLAPHINRFLCNKLDNISDEHLTNWLHILHKYLWPDENNINEPNELSDDVVNLNKIMEYLEVVLTSNGIFQNLNCIVNILLEKFNLFLSSIQYQDINRCLLYHLFDVIIKTLCSRKE